MTTRTQLWVICSMNQFLWQYFDQYLVALLVVNIIRMRTPLQHSEHNISHWTLLCEESVQFNQVVSAKNLVATIHNGVIGVSLSDPHTSETALCMCVSIYTCLQPYTVTFKWGHSNILWRSISWSICIWRPMEGYCQSGMSATQSKDDWSQSTCCSIRISG